LTRLSKGGQCGDGRNWNLLLAESIVISTEAFMDPGFIKLPSIGSGRKDREEYSLRVHFPGCRSIFSKSLVLNVRCWFFSGTAVKFV
jgi:hypothetical protein